MEQNQKETTDATQWVCPRCGQVNGLEPLCSGCGFDISVDYLAYPTLAKLSQEQLVAQNRALTLEKGRQRPQRKKRWLLLLGVVLPFLGISLIAFGGRTKVDTSGAEIASDVTLTADADMPEDTGAIDSTDTVDGTTNSADGGMNNEADDTFTTDDMATAVPSGNVLGDVGSFDSNGDGTTLSLDGVTAKKDITEVFFLNTLADAPTDATDLSAAGNGDVLCWTEGTVQYIAGDGGVVGGSSCLNLFSGYVNVTAIHFSGYFDTSNVTDMRQIFDRCESLTSVDLSDWDTSNATNISNIFNFCRALASLDLSGWDTSNVTDMGSAFYECSALTSLDVSTWDTSNVTSMNAMFCSCTSLTSLDVSGWDTSSVTDMLLMFCECSSVTELDVSGWDTSSVTDMSCMFSDCTALATLYVSGWNTSNVTQMRSMFIRCKNLTALDMSSWDTSNVTDMSYMFSDCSSLTNFNPDWLDTGNANTTSMYNGTLWG